MQEREAIKRAKREGRPAIFDCDDLPVKVVIPEPDSELVREPAATPRLVHRSPWCLIGR